jgi:YD repeat-containing protein
MGSLKILSASATFSTAGTWSIKITDQSGATTYDSCSLTVQGQTPVTFSLSATTFTYSGTVQGPTVVSSPSGATFTTAGTLSATEVGTYTASATATGNFVGANSALTWQIVAPDPTGVASSVAPSQGSNPIRIEAYATTENAGALQLECNGDTQTVYVSAHIASGQIGANYDLVYNSSYTVNVTGSNVGSYALEVRDQVRDFRPLVAHQILINDKSVDAVTSDEIAAAGGKFTVRVKVIEHIPFGQSDQTLLAEGNVMRFGLGADEAGRSCGVLCYDFSPTSGLYGTNDYHSRGLQFYSAPGTLQVRSGTSGLYNRLQVQSASGWMDVSWLTAHPSDGSASYSINFYSNSAATSSSGAFLVFGGTPLVSYTITSVQTTEDTHYPTGFVTFLQTAYGAGISMGAAYLDTVTRTIDGVTRVLEFYGTSNSARGALPLPIVAGQTPAQQYLENIEQARLLWNWRAVGAPRGAVTQWLTHLSRIYCNGFYSYSQGGPKLLEFVYSGSTVDSPGVWGEVVDFPAGTHDITYTRPSSVQGGGYWDISDSSGVHTMPWDTAQKGLPGTYSKAYRTPESFTEIYGNYTVTDTNNNNLGNMPKYVWGKVKEKHEAFLGNALGSATDLVTDYTYATVMNGAKVLPATEVTTQNGVTVRSHAYSYSVGTFNGVETLQTQATQWANANAALVTTKLVYSSRVEDPDLRDRPLAETRPDGTMTVYAYQHGTLDTTTGVWSTSTSSSPVGTGPHVRTLQTVGKSGTGVSSILGCAVPTLDLAPNLAVVSEKITDGVGNVLRDATYLYVNNSFNLLNANYYQYNSWGRLLYIADQPIAANSTTNGRFLYAATYVGGICKSWERDQQGVQRSYHYDDYDRVQTVTQLASSDGAYSVPARVVTYTYDGKDNVLSETWSAVGVSDTLVTGHTYDLGARVLTETKPGAHSSINSKKYLI